MRTGSCFTVVSTVFAAAAPAAVHATVYMSVQQAQSEMFPGQRLVPQARDLTPAQIAAIKKLSGVGPLSKRLNAWRAQDGGWFIVDRVIGKHEFITYAVALGADGAVKRIEILEYRETYGGEVRNPKWRQQFVGKRFGAPLKLDKDIKNISGATLSSRHIAEGVRRLLASWAVVLRNA